MRTSAWLGTAGLLSILVPSALASEVAVDKVPKPIMDAVQARFADAKFAGAAKEKDAEGKDVYEISLTDKNMNNIDVTVTPEGALVMIEQQISRKELPEPVAKALEAKYAKARYRLVETITEVQGEKETLTAYEVLLMTPKKQLWAVKLGLDGKILLEEKKDPEAEDD